MGLSRGLAALFQHLSQPRWHLLLVGMGTQLRPLQIELAQTNSEIKGKTTNTPSRFPQLGPVTRVGLLARPGLAELVLAASRSGLFFPPLRVDEGSSKSTDPREGAHLSENKSALKDVCAGSPSSRRARSSATCRSMWVTSSAFMTVSPHPCGQSTYVS